MNKLFWKIMLYVVPFAMLAFFGLFMVFFTMSFMEVARLEVEGVRTQGIVLGSYKSQPSIKDISPIRTTSINYSFEVNGETYVDSALGSDKVGDVLTILYAKTDPKVSIPARVNLSEQKTFNGLGMGLVFLGGLGSTALVARILWRKVRMR